MLRKIGLPEFAKIEPSPGPLPRVEEEKGSKISRAKEHTSQERAQQMWDLFADLKKSWAQFVRAHNAEQDFKAHSPLHALLDEHNPIAQQFRSSPTFKALQPKLHALYSDPETRVAWEEGMRAHATQWENVNGTWEEYRTAEKRRVALEIRYDNLQKEKFTERVKSEAQRRRTLADDMAEIELSLADIRIELEELRQKSPELAAKILASELEKRRKELQSLDAFMWFDSRRAIYEEMEAHVAENPNLRMLVLEGQAGTGKTSFVRVLARKFTGSDPVEVTIKAKTKVDRQLMADETLDPAHPVVYRSVLQAITGKARPEDAPAHDGRVGFADELNKGDNDEVGDLATVLDGMKVGGKTRYGALGANPDDLVQTKAVVVAAQNPAGARFLNRTKFTPEVQRKLKMIQLGYFPQTKENPELYEAFQVWLKDQDGRTQAKREELAPAWTPESIKNSAGQEIGTKDKLITDPKQGGVLWRMAQMLHQSYENLYKRKNVLTDANPDAHLQGRVLPPGDVGQWLQSYRKEVKKGVSLESYLSRKFKDWIDSSFTADHDQQDKQLYLELAEKYGIVKKVGTEYQALESAKISIDILTPRDIAEMSPRVPRKFIPKAVETRPPELTRAVMDWTAPDGTLHRRLEVRYEALASPKRYRLPDAPPDSPPYIVLGTIKECTRVPALVGQLYLKKAEEVRPPSEFAYNETEARRLGLEKLEIRAYPEAQRCIEQVINKTIAIATDAGKTQFVQDWQSNCPDLPMPCVLKNPAGARVTALADADLAESNFWYLTQLQSGKIITNLEGPDQPALPQFGEQEVVLVDTWTETDHNAPDASVKHKSPLLKELLNHESTVNINRQDLNVALWIGDPAKRIPTEKHQALLQKLGVDPNQFELRCIRQDEYARASNIKGWGQKQLWTNFDHYFLEGDGARHGLSGGYRDHGGPSSVGRSWRGSVVDSLSVRLVLARNPA